MAAFTTITGNLTRDPEMKTIGAQQACVFSVAARTRTKNDDGTYKTNFYDCTFFGKMGEFFMARAQKGTAVTVVGELTADAYLSNGEARPSLRLNVNVAECQGRMKEPGSAPAKRETASRADENIAPF